MAAVLLDLKLFAACDDLWGGPPGPRPTPTSARFWLRLCCSVGQDGILRRVVNPPAFCADCHLALRLSTVNLPHNPSKAFTQAT